MMRTDDSSNELIESSAHTGATAALINHRSSLRLLLNNETRNSIRTLLIGLYFVIFECLLLFQKPFLQTSFATTFRLIFAFLFLHHFVYHLYFDRQKSVGLTFFTYFFDVVLLIIFMRFFPQLSSFLLVLQLLFLFLASFDLNFYYLPFVS